MLAHGVDRVDIDDLHLVGQERLARQRQRLGRERRIAVASARVAAIASISAGRRRVRSPRLDGRDHVQQHAASRIAGRTPSARTDRCRARRGSADRSGDSPDSFTGAEKPRSSDGTGGLATSTNVETVFRLRGQQHARAGCARGFAGQPRRQFLAVAVQQSHRDRESTNGCLSGWPGVGLVRLANGQRVAFRRRIVGVVDGRPPACRPDGTRAWKSSRSTPDASAIACTKSSMVTAWLSWRCEIQVHAAAERCRGR